MSAKIGRHPIERAGKILKLVPGRHIHPVLEITPPYGLRTPLQLLDGPGEVPGDGKGQESDDDEQDDKRSGKDGFHPVLLGTDVQGGVLRCREDTLPGLCYRRKHLVDRHHHPDAPVHAPDGSIRDKPLAVLKCDPGNPRLSRDHLASDRGDIRVLAHEQVLGDERLVPPHIPRGEAGPADDISVLVDQHGITPVAHLGADDLLVDHLDRDVRTDHPDPVPVGVIDRPRAGHHQAVPDEVDIRLRPDRLSRLDRLHEPGPEPGITRSIEPGRPGVDHRHPGTGADIDAGKVPIRCRYGDEYVVHHPCGVALLGKVALVDPGREEEDRGCMPFPGFLILQVEVARPDHGRVCHDSCCVAFHDTEVSAHLFKEDVADVGLILRKSQERLLGIALKRDGAVVHRTRPEIGAPLKCVPADIIHLHEGKRTRKEEGGHGEAQEYEKDLGPDGDPAVLSLALAHHMIVR
ncbi:hypothetical protein DSECCO2_605940 [anaerobic digester metagenome]